MRKEIDQLSNDLKINLQKNSYFIFTYHPETKYLDDEIKKLKIILKSFKQITDKKFLITSSNHDVASNRINDFLISFTNKNKQKFFFRYSLGSINYLNLISYSSGVIGNSSSGVIEVPFFKVPTINIGLRQSGRYMHKSVINTNFDQKNIVKAINKAINPKFLRDLKNLKNTLIKKNVSLNCYKKIISIHE